MVPYGAGDHFEQIFLLLIDAWFFLADKEKIPLTIQFPQRERIRRHVSIKVANKLFTVCAKSIF